MFRYRETCCEVITMDPNIFQWTFEWVKRAKMLVLWERLLFGQYFMTTHDTDLNGFGHAGSCREYTSLRSDGWVRGNPKLDPVLEVKVTYHVYQYGIDIRIDSMKNEDLNPGLWKSRSKWNWHQRWFHEEWGQQRYEQIRRRTSWRKCEFLFTTIKLITGTERPVATKQKEQSTPPWTSLSTMVVPIDQRKWIPAVDNVDQGSLSFSDSKTMTRILRHRGLHRERGGAVDWDIWLLMFCREYGDALRWTNHEWIDHLHRGSEKARFQHCLNSGGFIHYMCAIQGNSGGNKVDPLLLDNVKIRACGVSTFITLVLFSVCVLVSTQDWLQGKKIQKKEDKQYSSPLWILWVLRKRKNTKTCQSHERYTTKPSGKSARMLYFGLIWERLKKND